MKETGQRATCEILNKGNLAGSRGPSLKEVNFTPLDKGGTVSLAKGTCYEGFLVRQVKEFGRE